MMLTSTGSGPISPVSRTKAYYPAQKRGAAAQAVSGHNYDFAEFSAPAGRKSFQMEMVSRLSREVRTANTTGRCPPGSTGRTPWPSRAGCCFWWRSKAWMSCIVPT